MFPTPSLTASRLTGRAADARCDGRAGSVTPHPAIA
jgi:hypothetical protein